MQWSQIYDPFGHWWLSTLVAALPILVLFGLLAGLKVKPHLCAIAGALTAMGVAVLFFKMPLTLAAMSFGYGVEFGLLKIAWIVLAAVYLYDISVETGQFEIMKESIVGITPDRRLQVLLVGCVESNCQHCARGLGSNRYSGAHAGGRLRIARIRLERDDRPHPPIYRDYCAVLAGANHGRLARDV